MGASDRGFRWIEYMGLLTWFPAGTKLVVTSVHYGRSSRAHMMGETVVRHRFSSADCLLEPAIGEEGVGEGRKVAGGGFGGLIMGLLT